MATYQEIKQLESSPILLAVVEVAIWKSISAIAAEAPATAHHGERVGWAINALRDTKAEAQKILRLALASNSSSTVAQIMAATDSAIQTVVDSVVGMLAGY